MGRFDDIVNNAPTVTQPRVGFTTTGVSYSVNRFDDIFNNIPNRFDDIVSNARTTPIQGEGQSLLQRGGSAIGGAFVALGKFLSKPQRAVSGVFERGLETVGILEKKGQGLGIKKAVKEDIGYAAPLRRIAEETAAGKFVFPPTATVFNNFTREFAINSIGVTADIFLDPLFLLGKAGKVKQSTVFVGSKIKTAWLELQKEHSAVQKVNEMLGRAFITRFGQREGFKEMDRARKIAESEIASDMLRVVSPVIERPKAIQQRIAQVVKGGITTNDEIQMLADPIRKEFDRVGKFISDVNPKLLKPEIFEARKGTYFPRLFTESEFGDDIVKFFENFSSPKAIGVPKARFISRLPDVEFAKGYLLSKGKSVEFIDEYTKLLDVEFSKGVKITDIRGVGKNSFLDLQKIGINSITDLVNTDKTGEFIQDTFEPFSKLRKIFGNNADNVVRAAEELLDENAKALKTFSTGNASKIYLVEREIKKLAELSRKELGEITEAGYPALKGLSQLRLVEERQKFFLGLSKIASDSPNPGWIQLGEAKELGKLGGKFLPRAEAAVVAQQMRVATEFEKIYQDSLSLWKTFKTAYNPSTIARNDITNYLVLNPLGGVGPHRVDLYMHAVKEYLSGGSLYQLARKQGLEISTHQAAELEKQAVRFYQTSAEAKGFFKTASSFHQMVKNFYGSQDKVFKLANFIKGVQEDGFTPYEAMKRANFYLIDYSEVPELIQWFRKSPVGAPFIAFSYGVSLPLAKTLLERPDKLSAYYKILSGIQNMNVVRETPQEQEYEKDVLPDWINSGTYLRLPVKDEYKRSQYLNLQYLLPWNLLEQITGGNKTLVQNLLTLQSNPLFTITAGIATNKDPFFSKEIWKDTDSTTDKVQKQAMYVMRALFPSFTPIGFEVNGKFQFAGNSIDKILQASKKRPDTSGYVKSWLQVLGDVFGGIKITPIDPTLEAQKRASQRKGELNDLRDELFRIARDKTLFPEEKEVRQEEVRQQIQRQ